MMKSSLVPSGKSYKGWDAQSLFATDEKEISNNNEKEISNNLYDSYDLKQWTERTDVIDSSFEIGDDDSLQNNNNDDDYDDIRDSLEVPLNINTHSVSSLNRSKKFDDWNPNSIFDGSNNVGNNIYSSNDSNNNSTKINRNSINKNTATSIKSIRSSDSNIKSIMSAYEEKGVVIDDQHLDDDSLDGNKNCNNDDNYNNYDDNNNHDYGRNYNETNIAVTDIQRLVRGHLGRKAANRILLHNERNRLKMKQRMKAKYLEHVNDYTKNNTVTQSGDKDMKDVSFFKANRKVAPSMDKLTTEIIYDYIDNDATRKKPEEYHSNNNQHINILKLDIDQYNQHQEYRQSKELSPNTKINDEEVHYFSMKNNKKNSPTSNINKYQNYDHEGTYVIRSNQLASPTKVPHVAPEKKSLAIIHHTDDAKVKESKDAKSSGNIYANSNANNSGIKSYGIKDLYAQTPSHVVPSILKSRNDPVVEIKKPSPIELDKRYRNNHAEQYHHNEVDPYKRKSLQRRHKAATLIQRVFRGFLGRKRAAARKRLWVGKFKCSNCGRLEQTGVYCKGCGRRIHNDKAHNIQKQLPRQEKVRGNKERVVVPNQQREDNSNKDKGYEFAPAPQKKVKMAPERRFSAPPSQSNPHRSHASPRRSEVDNVNLESTITLNSIERKLLDEINALDQKQKLRTIEQKLEKDLYDLNDQLSHHGKAPSIIKDNRPKDTDNNRPKPHEQKKVPFAGKEKLAFGPGAKDFRSNDPPKPVKKKIDNFESPSSPVIKKVGLKLQEKSVEETALNSPGSIGPPTNSKVNPPFIASPGYSFQYNKKGENKKVKKVINGADNYDNISRLDSISEN